VPSDDELELLELELLELELLELELLELELLELELLELELLELELLELELLELELLELELLELELLLSQGERRPTPDISMAADAHAPAPGIGSHRVIVVKSTEATFVSKLVMSLSVQSPCTANFMPGTTPSSDPSIGTSTLPEVTEPTSIIETLELDEEELLGIGKYSDS
jgi:hypothetical protein